MHRAPSVKSLSGRHAISCQVLGHQAEPVWGGTCGARRGRQNVTGHHGAVLEGRGLTDQSICAGSKMQGPGRANIRFGRVEGLSGKWQRARCPDL